MKVGDNVDFITWAGDEDKDGQVGDILIMREEDVKDEWAAIKGGDTVKQNEGIKPYDLLKMQWLINGGKQGLGKIAHTVKSDLSANGGTPTENEICSGVYEQQKSDPKFVELYNENYDGSEQGYKHKT